MSGRDQLTLLWKSNLLYLLTGRAGRTGQSQTGECYVIAHERDMKPVNLFFESSVHSLPFLRLASRNVIYCCRK